MLDSKILYLKWHDAAGADGWIESELLEKRERKLAIIETIGFLVTEDDASVTLSMAKDVSNSNYGAYMHIPKLCIKKRKIIKS